MGVADAPADSRSHEVPELHAMTGQHPESQGFLNQRCQAFRFAFRGLRVLLRTQFHAQVHLAATMSVVLAGVFSQLSATEWSLLFLVIGLVWVAEAINTAIEFAVDLASPEIHDLAAGAKDTAAAAVLLAAFTAVLCGLCIFGPRLLTRFVGWSGWSG